MATLFDGFDRIDKEVFVCAMEKQLPDGYYYSLTPSPQDWPNEHKLFFVQHNFMIGYGFFEPEWDNNTQLVEIYKRLMHWYNFKKLDNLTIVRGQVRVHLEDGKYIPVPPGGIFVYDCSKIKVEVEEVG
jgi:hypothetical protein